MSAARLEVVAGKAVGMTIIVEDELLIGRQADGPGRLADDDEISRSHARLSVDTHGLCAIEDLGSTNGTFVNGLRLSCLQTVFEGDTIEIGETTLVVKEVSGPGRPEPGGPELPQPTAGAVSEPLPGVGEPPAGTEGSPPSAGEPPRLPHAPVLSLQLEVDFDAREAQLILDQASEPLRLVFDAGMWRAVSSTEIEREPVDRRRPAGA